MITLVALVLVLLSAVRLILLLPTTVLNIMCEPAVGAPLAILGVAATVVVATLLLIAAPTVVVAVALAQLVP